MDRCAQALNYHHQGYNCAQSVAGAFADLLGMNTEQVASFAGGFGGGVGGSHEELCGAVSGGVMVLSALFPHDKAEDTAAKRRIYGLSKTFRSRFAEIFGMTCCGDLLKACPGLSEATPAATRLGVSGHCDIMIVTAVELVEQMLEEVGREKEKTHED